MLKGIGALLRPKKKRKTGGTSRLTRRVSFRLTNADHEILVRRADRYNGGDMSEYLRIKIHRELNFNHNKRKGGANGKSS